MTRWNHSCRQLSQPRFLQWLATTEWRLAPYRVSKHTQGEDLTLLWLLNLFQFPHNKQHNSQSGSLYQRSWPLWPDQFITWTTSHCLWLQTWWTTLLPVVHRHTHVLLTSTHPVISHAACWIHHDWVLSNNSGQQHLLFIHLIHSHYFRWMRSLPCQPSYSQQVM